MQWRSANHLYCSPYDLGFLIESHRERARKYGVKLTGHFKLKFIKVGQCIWFRLLYCIRKGGRMKIWCRITGVFRPRFISTFSGLKFIISIIFVMKFMKRVAKIWLGPLDYIRKERRENIRSRIDAAYRAHFIIHRYIISGTKVTKVIQSMI